MTKHWNIAANFFTGQGDRWLDDFIEDEALVFKKIPSVWRDNWHERGKVTGAREWLEHFQHARRAMRDRPDGLITCYPQLAVCAGALKAFGFGAPRIVAHNFNLGEISNPIKRRLAGWAGRQIDRFLVHSPVEVIRYSRWLGLPAERFEFVPLQRGRIEIGRDEDMANPFVLSMGSAQRDYDTLVRAVGELGIRTVIVTRQDEIDRLPKPANVEFRTGLTELECLELLSRARLSVTPISNMETASGQITFINAMQLGVPVLATRCPGTDGYIEDSKTGILLEPFDVADMRAHIELLWGNNVMREKIGAAGKQSADRRFSDQAAADNLRRVLSNFAD